MALKHKHVIGIFPDRQIIESAIAKLRETEFPSSRLMAISKLIE